MDHDDEAFQNARIKIATMCRERGVTPGIHASATLAPKHAEAGYRMITVSSDVGAMAGAAGEHLRSLRDVDATGRPAYS
jgi:hypothetical protein